MIIRDQNGERLTASVHRNPDGPGWMATVWWGGGLYGFATDVRGQTYQTREQARRADISTPIGERGRIA